MSIGTTRWFESKRSVTIETEESAVSRRGRGPTPQVTNPSWVWCDIVHLGVYVCVETYKFKWQGSDYVFKYQVMSNMR